MVLRSRTFLTMTLFALLLGVGSAQAQTKRKAAPKAAAPKPAAPALTEMRVCVRPKGVGEKVQKWGYDRTNKVVTTNVESEVRFAGGRWIYVFDQKAPLDSYLKLPIAHQVKCPNDDRKPPEPAAPKPEGILPKSGPLFASANPLAGANPSLAPRGFSSSGTTAPNSAKVDQFCTDAEDFSAGEEAHEVQASEFANKLRESILAKKSIGLIKTDELSVEAAGVLAKQFGENIAAALERADVIAPFDVLQQFKPNSKYPSFEPFALVEKQSMSDLGMGSADTVLAVMLSRTEFDRMATVVRPGAATATTKESLLDVYKRAYLDRPAWLGAIKGYFETK